MAASSVQIDRSRTSLASNEGLANFEAVRLIRDLAHKQKSQELAQLATRMASAMQSSSGDPFLKVKGLIMDMIAKLEAEAGQDATKKAGCDKELSEANTKKAEKTALVGELICLAPGEGDAAFQDCRKRTLQAIENYDIEG